MSLHLDPRQRAMLQEMGIRLFLPAAPPPLPSARPAQAGAAAPPAAAPPPPAPPPVAASRPAPSAAAPAPAPGEAGTCAPAWLAPALAPYADGAAPVPPAERIRWLVLLECAHPAAPLEGEAGRLLDNMLRAAGLHRHPDTRIAALLRPSDTASAPDAAPPPGAPLPEALAQLQPDVVLLLGLGTARAVLGSRAPLARLRADTHRLPHGTPAVVSHDPAYLLRAAEAKADAWADLCRALVLARGLPGRPAASG